VSDPDARHERLAEIADQVRDGWVRGRGPLTGLKPLIAVRVEVLTLEPDEDYLATLDEIIVYARAIVGGSSQTYRRDAPQSLEKAAAKLRDLCRQDAAEPL
jgi:hypothetical protein